MVIINFMPWRRQQLQQQWRRWGWGIICLLMLLTSCAQYGYWQYRLNQQRQHGLTLWPVTLRDVADLHKRTQVLHRQIQQQQQTIRLRAQRQQKLVRWREFMQFLEDNIPENIWLQRLQKDQQHIAIQGFSRSITGLHRLRDDLHKQAEVQAVKLGTLRRESSGDIHFTLQIMLKSGVPDDE